MYTKRRGTNRRSAKAFWRPGYKASAILPYVAPATTNNIDDGASAAEMGLNRIKVARLSYRERHLQTIQGDRQMT